MLYLIFCAYPNKDEDIFSYDNEKNSTIWETNSKEVKKLSKPYGYRKLFKLYNNFIN